jgi:hypothetical protein
MKNRGHFSDYGEGMRIKNEHLGERIRRTGWQATKSRAPGLDKNVISVEFFSRDFTERGLQAKMPRPATAATGSPP